MYISAFPTLSLKEIFRKGQNLIWDTRFEGGEAYFYFRGANAIWNGISLLGLSDEDNILVPAYHCGVEIQAILETNVKIKFYAIKDTLECDLSDIQRKIDERTRAIFVIHYFGFPQPLDVLRGVCRSHGLLLIEDCAHAMLSRYEDVQLGKVGEMAIFSLKKFFPVPDGGVLVVNKKLDRTPKVEKNIQTIFLARTLILLIIGRLKLRCSCFSAFIDFVILKPMRLSFTIFKNLTHRNKEAVISDAMNFNRAIGHKTISPVSLRIINAIDFDTVVEKRRSNFLFLFEKIKDLKGIEIPFKSLPEGVCPLFLPIFISRRDETQAALKQRGVETFIFGKWLHSDMPKSEFLEAEYLSGHNLCLPIHQDLEQEHLTYMAEELRKAITT